MVYITRRVAFSAAHRLYRPEWSDEQNWAVFDKCANPNGHGHNYMLEVTLSGIPDPETGYVMDLKHLAQLLEQEIVSKVDHKHLNYDVDFLQGINPTVENLAIVFWQVLQRKLPAGQLYAVRVYESENNYAEYRGEPLTPARNGMLHTVLSAEEQKK
ncbi:MAG: 6-carboxytetrahydropterin synthase [Candidatus Kapabacteria bacterium]|nr:6-carboxytetrahydropterin synthase [Candidatus Kapabacteria bacterium]MCS7169374.1 6-carboxytetrahydropterin synthase [Candidatus Kapabacteria bacterium]MDW7996791.1 6-carboxytetrahydropterin synthase [Bacteroidota bacterium]MDW8225129.1 6-carboxytetrahydropterin synthase [Bacteroidota bacterium]